MAQRILPGIGLTGFWALGYDGWKDEMDANLRLLSLLVQAKVISRTSSLPESDASQGDVYIVPAEEPSESEGHQANFVAIFDNDEWVEFEPLVPWQFYIVDEDIYVRWNGEQWIKSSSSSYDFGFSFESAPDPSSIIGRVIIGRPIRIKEDFEGALGNAVSNPDALYEIDVQADEVSVGTVSISTGGVFTFTSLETGELTFPAGTVFTFVASSDSEPDPSLTGVSVVFQATEI